SACAAPTASSVADDSSFGIPSELADKFTVKGKDAPTAAINAPEPEPVKVAEAAAPAKGKKGKRGKKGNARMTAAKSKSAKAPAAASPKPASTVKPFENRWAMQPFFDAGEKHRFDITYFGATAGSLELELLDPKVVNERPSYHLRAIARSVAPFTLFYSLNDTVESFMDSEGLFAHKFTVKIDESLQQRDILELYDQKAHRVYYWSKLDHKKKGKSEEKLEIDTAPYAQDGLSAFYYLRTLPFEIGKSYEFPVVNNGKLRTVKVTALRKEELKTKVGTFDTIVLKPEVSLDGAIKSYGDSFVWVSDDPRRIILKVDAKIKVGSVIAYLREHKDGQGHATTGR
ncbi:MAG: DUF3108 domain-containing protein, partial [Proteobacteria bacterium]